MPFFALSRFELSWHVDMSFLGGPKKHRFQELRTFFSRPTTSEICKPTVYPSQKPFEKLRNHHYLVVSTTLEKYASQIGSFPQEGVKINNIPPRSSTRVFNLQ